MRREVSSSQRIDNTHHGVDEHLWKDNLLLIPALLILRLLRDIEWSLEACLLHLHESRSIDCWLCVSPKGPLCNIHELISKSIPSKLTCLAIGLMVAKTSQTLSCFFTLLELISNSTSVAWAVFTSSICTDIKKGPARQRVVNYEILMLDKVKLKWIIHGFMHCLVFSFLESGALLLLTNCALKLKMTRNWNSEIILNSHIILKKSYYHLAKNLESLKEPCFVIGQFWM